MAVRLWRLWGVVHRDLVLATALAAVCVVALGVDGQLSPTLGHLASVATIAVPVLVAWRKRAPVLVALVAGPLLVVPALTSSANADYNGVAGIAVVVAVFLLAYSLGAESPWRPSAVALVVLTAGFAFTAEQFNPIIEMLTVGPWLGGAAVASRRRTASLLELRARQLEEEQEVFAVRSVRYERAQIARELHDIVAHCVSLMVVQANAGAHLTHNDPASADEAFASISETARQAEAEIDRLVALLGTSGATAQRTSLRIVEELARRVRDTGVAISCELSADSELVSDRCAETAYRIVQESVTNAMKHAPGAPITVAVRRHGDDLEVDVANGAALSARSGLEDAGGGNGLSGMRERAGACGGTVEAGPTDEAGWRVTARLPRRDPAPSGGPLESAVR